jgi:hypothetical protein
MALDDGLNSTVPNQEDHHRREKVAEDWHPNQIEKPGWPELREDGGREQGQAPRPIRVSSGVVNGDCRASIVSGYTPRCKAEILAQGVQLLRQTPGVP